MKKNESLNVRGGRTGLTYICGQIVSEGSYLWARREITVG